MFKIISSVISDRFCAPNINIASADCASGHLTRLKSIFVFLMLFRSSYLKIIFVFCSVLCSGPNIKEMPIVANLFSKSIRLEYGWSPDIYFVACISTSSERTQYTIFRIYKTAFCSTFSAEKNMMLLKSIRQPNYL